MASVNGMVFTSNYVNIGLIAEKVGTTSVGIGSIFIIDAVGCVFGGLLWPLLSHYVGGSRTILVASFAIVVTNVFAQVFEFI